MFGGAKGGGKSDCLLAEASRQVKNPNYKGIIFRRTYPKLQELIDRSHRCFSWCAKWNGEKRRWTWPNGASVTFGHCKNESDKYNYQGHEYQFMGFDQLEEFTESQFTFLKAQCRTSDDTLRCYIRSTSNPAGVGHQWVKSRYIDKCPPDGTVKFFRRDEDDEVETDAEDPKGLSRAYVFANVYDNQILLQSDPNYLLRLKELPDKLRRALLEGDWDAFEGQYFAEWRSVIHVIPHAMWLRIKRSMPYITVIGMDYGYSKPSSVGWYAVFPDGSMIRYREFYAEGYTYLALIKKVLSLSLDDDGKPEQVEYMVADPAIWGDKAHHVEYSRKPSPKLDGKSRGKSGYDIMAEVVGERFPILMADNRRVVGWTRMREFLNPFRDPNTERVTANFIVTEHNKNFIRTISGLIHDDQNPEDLDTSGEDHAADEARYVIMSRPALPKKPAKVMTPADEFWGRVQKDVARYQARKAGEEGMPVEVTEEGAVYIEE